MDQKTRKDRRRRNSRVGVPPVSCFCLLALAAVSGFGCAHMPYRLGAIREDEHTLRLRPEEPQIEVGRKVAFVDGLGHYVVSLPSKLLLWNWRVDNHNISPGTIAHLRQYLHANGLHNVKVRVNQYAPGREWSRLFRNQAVSAPWRYTLGVVSVAMYTIMPGRVFGGDHYNPYTNTINLYSDVAAIAVHEGAHAKDFAGRSRGFRGFYAFVRGLPLVPLVQEAFATGDTVGYYRAHNLTEDEKAAYKILYPAYGTYVGGEFLQLAPSNRVPGILVTYAAALPGHLIGRIKSLFVPDRPGRE